MFPLFRIMGKCLLRVSVGLVGYLLVATVGLAADAIKNSDCLECHSDKTLSKTNALGVVQSLFIEEPKFIASVHKTNNCTTCHSDLTSKHPDDNVAAKPVNCASCHEPKQSNTLPPFTA